MTLQTVARLRRSQRSVSEPFSDSALAANHTIECALPAATEHFLRQSTFSQSAVNLLGHSQTKCCAPVLDRHTKCCWCWIGTRGLAISAGSAHSIVLVRTSVGKAGLMSFGSNDEGQLGHGQQVSEVICDRIMSILHACLKQLSECSQTCELSGSCAGATIAICSPFSMPGLSDPTTALLQCAPR